ncbi:division/cell wall cluster transcriptional repressor MraZ [soil metagenome]
MEFFDQFEHTIDDKGRLVLPAAYRNAFVDGGFLALIGNYAGLFTADGWEKYRRRLELSGKFERQQLQVLLSFVSPFTPDSQHRIAINSRLRGKVGLGREVTIVGSGSHAAIYARDVWAAIEEDALAPDESGQTIADKFNDLDFL